MNSNKKIKIGIIGNMNNNNFSILRYFHDLGIEADLLLNQNDGKYESSHFRPECDTWEINKWKSYFKYTKLDEDPSSVFSFPISIFFIFRNFFRKKKSIPISDNYIKTTLSIYTHLIGSGLTPAITNRIDRKLDMYFPYAIGVEWIGDPVFLNKLNSNNLLISYLSKLIKKKQQNGLKNTKHVLSIIDTSITENNLKCLGINPIRSLCPMVYNLESIPNIIPEFLIEHIDLIKNSDFTVFSHARHLWVNHLSIDEFKWVEQDKNNDWLIKSFFKLVKTESLKNPILILIDYGPDTMFTKALIKELNLQNFVIWLPKLERKYIIYLISMFDVTVGEFYQIPNIVFGGTGYEVMSCGKPLIQGFDFLKNEFFNTYGVPEPPLMKVKYENDVFIHLLDLSKNIQRRIQISKDSKQWFNEYCGIGLAKKWSNILLN